MSRIGKIVAATLFGYAAYKLGRITEMVVSDEGVQEVIKERKEAIENYKIAKKTGQTLKLEMNREHLMTFLEPAEEPDEPETEESEDQPED